MSLIKSIIHGKEHRKMYKGAKSFCYACCNHKSCTYCERNRLYNYLKEIERIEIDIKEFEKDY